MMIEIYTGLYNRECAVCGSAYLDSIHEADNDRCQDCLVQ